MDINLFFLDSSAITDWRKEWIKLKKQYIRLKEQRRDCVHAKWTYGNDGTMKCTRCRRRIRTIVDFKYCPNCGAKMDLEGQSGEVT